MHLGHLHGGVPIGTYMAGRQTVDAGFAAFFLQELTV